MDAKELQRDKVYTKKKDNRHYYTFNFDIYSLLYWSKQLKSSK